MQDFFGMLEVPALCGGRVSLIVHLLAPNHRAVQVTSDLKSFWQNHYPKIRKELSRNYPKHSFPEIPTLRFLHLPEREIDSLLIENKLPFSSNTEGGA